MREKEQRTLSTSGAVSTIAQIGSDPPMRRIKILLLGDSNVGKTSIIGRLTTGDFRETLAQTVGVDYKVKKMHVDGELVQVRSYWCAASVMEVIFSAGTAVGHRWTGKVPPNNDFVLPRGQWHNALL